MEFRKEDENYIYEIISKNVKKYRKLKGWTQEKLADEINYSLSFISGIESAYHQTFSLGAVWRISRALGVDFSKLCEDDNLPNKTKSIIFKCQTCGEETKFPSQIIKALRDVNDLTGNKKVLSFDCTKEECDGKLFPENPMDL